MAVREVDWLELPDHLTVFMSDKLSRCDFIRFSAVCKPWNSIYNAHSKHSLPHQLPLLLVPNYHENVIYDTHTFYEFHEKRMYRFKVLVPFFMDYKGSSHGCLVLVWGQGKGVHVRISFPLLSKHEAIYLPPLRGELSDIKKVILSANPSSNHNYTVMAVINYREGRLAFFKPTAGDQVDWTYISRSYENILDILYYNKNQQFYFVEKSGTVFACDVNDPNDPKVLPILARPFYASFGQSDKKYWRNGYWGIYLHLVELSSGELVLIKMCKKYNKDKSCYCIIGFSVYKTNPLVEPKWIEVQNLSGDTVFLGNYSSVAVRASDFCECRPNCIYFTDRHEWSDLNHIGVFSLEEGIIIERYPIKVNDRLPPIWIEPTLPPIWIEPTLPQHC